MIRFLIAITTLAVLGPNMAAAQTCGGVNTPCILGERSYHLRLPDDWDGKTAMPVLLHFHGWMRQGDLVIRHGRIAASTVRRGVLLIAPNGARRTWDFWTAQTDDVGFAADVLADVAQAYPIDPTRIYVSGYSYGSAMAWRYVCQNGDGVRALIAVSGTLRNETACPQGPTEVRHVHGLDDTVMDFPMGPGGDTTWPVKLWRDQFGCGDGTAAGPWQARDWLTFDRTEWRDCDDGRAVILDLHPGGHFIPHGWIGRQLDELLDLTPSYP